ncbi:MAG: FAD-binding oxidoreductase [Alphaproteobacteria bacterium]|nr:FAD-binding oxidoreductase [Alphaproteobacteria bacterium]
MTISEVPSSTEMLDRYAASRDLWPGGTLAFWHGESAPRPERVFWPETDEQAAAVLAEASQQGIPVVPYGLGSGVCGGARGREGSWSVDTKRLIKMGPLDEARWTVEVEAGVNGQQLEDALTSRGFTLGHSPSSISCSSVGGWAAARSAGQFSSKYGVFEDMVLGLTAATATGEVLKIGTHGDDDPALMPLLLGSEGTLGVITRCNLRVWKAPEARWLRGYRFSTIDDALDAMRRLMQAELWPSVVRLYDPIDTRIGGKTKPKASRKQGTKRWYRRWLSEIGQLDPIRRRTLALPLALPGVVNRLFEGIASGCLLIVGWEGRPAVVEALTAAGRSILEERGEDLGAGPGNRWYQSRHAVSYKLMPVFERGGFADTMEIAARWTDLPRVYRAVREAVTPHAVVLAHMSHVYPEGGSIYFSFAGRGSRSVYEAVWNAAQDAVLAQGATITHHHGVGALKAKWASAEVGAAVEGWREAKARLDPNGVMNPGRLFVPVPPRDAGPDPRLHETDGLVRFPVAATPEERAEECTRLGVEQMFPWEALPAPARWTRSHWQVGWTEVSGRVGAQHVRLGRGPRSATGPDLRPWLVAHGDCRCTVPVVPAGERWLGAAKVDRPWEVARELLRSDLRPAVLDVVDGELRVGFRGPACRQLGAVASRWVPGGLTERDWEAFTLPSGPLEPCATTDADCVAVTAQGGLRRART